MSEWPTPTTVYGLWSTRDRTIRYIGQTTNEPKLRLYSHRADAKAGKATPVSRWFAFEISSGYDVRLRILNPYGDADVSEREYIALYRALGAPLLNATKGSRLQAEYPSSVVTPEMRLKMSRAQKGRKATEQTKARLRRAADRKYNRALAEARHFMVTGLDRISPSQKFIDSPTENV